MVSIKIIADGLSKQIEAAINGKADAVQAKILCTSVDSLIKLARLQIEMGGIDWTASPESPVIEMESSVPVARKALAPPEPKASALTPALPKGTAKTQAGKEIERQILQFESRMASANDQEKVFLTDRINLQRNKLKRIEPDWKG